MKSAFTRLAVIAIVLIATGCAGTSTRKGGTDAEWEKTPISQAFEGRAVSVEVEDKVYFYHGNKLSIYDPQLNTWDHRPDVNPYRVNDAFAVTYHDKGSVYIISGKNAHFYRFDIKTKKTTKVRPMPAPLAVGVRLESDGGRYIYAATGLYNKLKPKNRMFRYDTSINNWEALGKMKTVNPLGRFSSGLSYWEDTVYAWGDHHVSYFDLDTKAWGKKIFHPMRYRPTLGKGGMYKIDRKDGSIYVTLGQGSNSVGVLELATQRFYYLRPRLPFLLSDNHDTLFLTDVNGVRKLNVLSSNEKAIYSIELSGLTGLDTQEAGQAADKGSSWDVHSVGRKGAGGELFRHEDSFTNMLFAPPYVYNHRKNILRRFKLKSKNHSWVGGCCGPHGSEFKFHKKFITRGAGSVYDDKRYIYLFSGHDKKFFRVDLWGGKLPKTEKERKNPQAAAEDILIKTMSRLPEKPSSNTAITFHDGAVWVVFDAKKRNMYRYDILRNKWSKAASLPANAQYDAQHGFVLSSTGDEMFLFAKDALFSYDSAAGWKSRGNFGFSFYEDGGMVTYDDKSKNYFVAVGNSTTALGIVDPSTGEGKILDLVFPDVVSVSGQRMFIDKGQLYIARGHNSAEIWTIPVKALK